MGGHHSLINPRLYQPSNCYVYSAVISKLWDGTGKTNSQYGTCWITMDGTNKKIKKEELDSYLAIGWVKGRKMKT